LGRVKSSPRVRRLDMVKVIITKSYKDYEVGKDYVVNANEAHSLIDGGYAKLFSMLTSRSLQGYSDKMMRPKRKKYGSRR
jgi:hypothetical protein